MDYCKWVEDQRGKTPTVTSWEGIEAEVVSDPHVSTHVGTVRKSWVGDDVVLTLVTVKANSIGKMHKHPSEQISIIVRGGVRVVMGDGKDYIAKAGSIVHLPGDVFHKFEILDEETEIFDVYHLKDSAEELRKSYQSA